MGFGALILKTAIPVFYASIAIEFLISVRKKRKIYRLNDSINSLSCGIINELMKIHVKWISIVPYTYIYQNFSVSWLQPDSFLAGLIVWLGVDCGYYWAHREMHMMNIGWTGHATHHSSEDLNYLTAFRQSMFGHFFGFLFYLPLALFFPPELYLFHYGLNMFYQFFIHTELIGKLHPIIEFVFNTPSHHRVHHARNPEYLDKNYGGILIIWDRMFGTFAEEKITPVYGLVHTLSTWDIVWAQFHHVVAIMEDVRRCSGFLNKVSILFAPPGWQLAEGTSKWIAPEIPPINPEQQKYSPAIPTKVVFYVTARFLTTFIIVVAFIYTELQFSLPDTLLMCAYITYCLEVNGIIMNRSPRSVPLEIVRIGLDFLVAHYFFPSIPLLRPLVGWFSAFAALSSVWLFLIRDEFRFLPNEVKTAGTASI